MHGTVLPVDVEDTQIGVDHNQMAVVVETEAEGAAAKGSRLVGAVAFFLGGQQDSLYYPSSLIVQFYLNFTRLPLKMVRSPHR